MEVVVGTDAIDVDVVGTTARDSTYTGGALGDSIRDAADVADRTTIVDIGADGLARGAVPWEIKSATAYWPRKRGGRLTSIESNAGRGTNAGDASRRSQSIRVRSRADVALSAAVVYVRL